MNTASLSCYGISNLIPDLFASFIKVLCQKLHFLPCLRLPCAVLTMTALIRLLITIPLHRTYGMYAYNTGVPWVVVQYYNNVYYVFVVMGLSQIKK